MASVRYSAGRTYRFLFGDNYRDIWATPIRVPILDLREHAGGLRATKVGGSAQTINLRFVSPTGAEYVFRPVFKERTGLHPDAFEGTLPWQVFRDGLSAQHPAAGLIAPSVMQAAGLLHPTPLLVVMPDDSLLGKFREEFAGKLGTIEQFPNVPDDATGFAGAFEIIDSEELLKRLNADPREHVDSRALLTARLTDLFLNDNDRHPGQWKWARLSQQKGTPWVPIARDRDKVIASYEGVMLSIARRALPKLARFDETYANPAALFDNAIEFDRRLLGGLDRLVWDSTAKHLVAVLTDSVIDAAFSAVPREYQSSTRGLALIVKSRRAMLPLAAERYYRYLSATADIHGTDADDRASVRRSGDGVIEVQLRTGTDAPWFDRRFDAHETKEIRVYLHGGNDAAVITGAVHRSIPVRVVGGNGTNDLQDSSTVGGRHAPTRLYDVGATKAANYKRDTVAGVDFDPDTAWNRRPWLRAYRRLLPPRIDHGSSISPIASLKTGSDLGFTPTLGFIRRQNGFRAIPYASALRFEAAYSFGVQGLKFELMTDNRRESSPVHFLSNEMVSQLEVVEFHGFGNETADLRGDAYRVRQTQWVLHPAIGLSFSPRAEVSLGPIVKYVTTDDAVDRFLAVAQPTGVGRFGQAGLQLDLRYDTRDHAANAQRGFLATATASVYPAVWDVARTFEVVGAVASAYVRLPILSRPVLALRAGGRKLFGAFPYYEAAYIGGSGSVRAFRHHQFVGDASLYGTTELRIPVAQFTAMLPLNLGLLGFVDAGRVYMDGDSPGGWHSAAGAGVWIGALNPNTGITVLLTNRSERRLMLGLGFSF